MQCALLGKQGQGIWDVEEGGPAGTGVAALLTWPFINAWQSFAASLCSLEYRINPLQSMALFFIMFSLPKRDVSHSW